MRVDIHKVILNLSEYAGLSRREMAEMTGVKQHKLDHFMSQGNARFDLFETIKLLDLHYDECNSLHTNELIL